MISNLSLRLKELRKSKDLTQEELGIILYVTPQAISKWENGSSIPDLQQLISIANYYNVSTDYLLGLDEDKLNDEINSIIKDCMDISIKEKNPLKAWNTIQSAIKKYPGNLCLLQQSIEFGCSLCYKENDTYNEESALEIYKTTIRQAKYIIENSSVITDILRSHMIMVLLHSSFGNIDEAIKHAYSFPWRTDMNSHMMCAFINHSLNEFETEIINLQRSLLQHILSSIDNLSQLGIAYENTEQYDNALKMYFSIIDLINYVFYNEDYVPALYKLENGNVYFFIARTYMKMKEYDNALLYLEKMINKEKLHLDKEKDEYIITNSFLNKSNWFNFANYRKTTTRSSVLKCIKDDCFKVLSDNNKYNKLVDEAIKMNNYS